MVEVSTLLPHDRGILGVLDISSSVYYVNAGLGCFAMRHFRKGETMAITIELWFISICVLDMDMAEYKEERLCQLTAEVFDMGY